MKKNLFIALMSILSVVLSSTLTSCENFSEYSELEGTVELPTETVYDTVYADRVVIQHDSVLVYIHDTVVINNDVYHTDTLVVHDTVVVNGDTVVKTDTIYMTRELSFDCYTFNSEGNIIAKTDEKDYYITFNVLIENSGDVYFQKESVAPFVLENTEAYFDYGDCTFFTVTKGEEEVTLEVRVKGARNIVINNQDVHPCTPFHVEADLTELPDEEIKGVTYEVAVIRYSLINGDDEVVETSRQYLYAPKSVEEEVNEKKVTITYSIEEILSHHGYWLVVNGLIDNTILPDTTAQVKIPLALQFYCGEPMTTYAEDFTLTLGQLAEASKTTINSYEESFNGMVVTYNELENMYSHVYTASGNQLTAEPKVRYFNDFVVSFGGEVKNIELPLNVEYVDTTSGAVTVEGDNAKKQYVVSYKASLTEMERKAQQEVNIIVDAITFDNQRVMFANRSISFSGVQNPRVFDCVVTSVNGGGHNFIYREIVGGVKGDWTYEPISEEVYSFIESGLQKANSSLSVFFKSEGGKMATKIGYLINYPSGKYIHYHTHGEEILGIDNVNLTMHSSLNTPILGVGYKTSGLIKMECAAGVYNQDTISDKETIYYY